MRYEERQKYNYAGKLYVTNLNADYLDGLNSTDFLRSANNLSDVNSSTARSNLGLGTGDTPTFSGVTLTGDAQVGSANAFYLGDPTVDGTWRIVISGGTDLSFERRESSVWVQKGSYIP